MVRVLVHHPVGPWPCGKLAIGCRYEVSSLTGAGGVYCSIHQAIKCVEMTKAEWWCGKSPMGPDCTGPRSAADQV